MTIKLDDIKHGSKASYTGTNESLYEIEKGTTLTRNKHWLDDSSSVCFFYGPDDDDYHFFGVEDIELQE